MISAGGSGVDLFIRTQNTINAAPDIIIINISTDPAIAIIGENFPAC